jgi:putative phosphoesterase
MKIGVFQDVHANLPALEKAIEIFRDESCDSIFHVGDLVGIGPYPKECLELVNSISEMECIMGNHDYWCGFGLPNPIPFWMSADEVEHQHWTYQQIDNQQRQIIQQWKFISELKIDNQTVFNFLHYGLNEQKNWFKPFIKNPNSKDLNELFSNINGQYIFYGHNHQASDIQGEKRYINIGSAGCYNRAIVRICIVEKVNSEIIITKRAETYQDRGLLEAFDKRNVPARDFIRNNFIIRGET